jgi:predicted metal-dependent hydrolase
MTGRVVQSSPAAEPLVEVRRSARRRRTVSAYRDGDRTVVLIPARMSMAEERRWVAAMLERLAKQDSKLRPGDQALQQRATALSRRYLAGAPRPASVRWVGNQGSRWGSCTPVDRTIRLSDRLQGMPGWVLDYVIVHELVHLRVPGHGPDFWAEVERYPRTERARGYLEGVSATAGLGLSDDDEAGNGADIAGQAEADAEGDGTLPFDLGNGE